MPRQNGRRFSDDIFKCIFMNENIWIWINISLNLLLRVKSTIFKHWFRYWLGDDQAPSHYLNQWWLYYRCIYATLGLNELRVASSALRQWWRRHLILSTNNFLLTSYSMPFTLHIAKPLAITPFSKSPFVHDLHGIYCTVVVYYPSANVICCANELKILFYSTLFYSIVGGD